MDRLGLPHRLWRLLPAGPRRRMAARLVALAAPRLAHPAPPATGGVIVAGEFTRASGLGESARLMLDALAALGQPAWPLDIGPLLPAHSADLPPPPPWTTLPPANAALVLHVNAPLLPLVLARLPRALVRGRRVVGYWAWELPLAPADWRAGARCVHEAWAPSRFTADALAPLLATPVRVVPHPLAVRPAPPPGLGRGDFGLPEAAVVVLVSFNLASSFARKNPLAAVAAFRAAFADRMDRLLLLKVSHADHHPQDFALLAAAVAGAPNIRLETRTMPPADAQALTAAADIVLSLHRSEGFGLVPAEAMLAGKPTIATGWSGNLDFMDAGSAALVRYRLVPAQDTRGVYALPGAVWAEPDIAHAAEWLRRLADDPPARAALGAAGQEYARARLGPAALAEALRGLAVGGAA
ncbi:MAG: glycosyltransferase family 4 protein [Proteobacteria bacterium]|nr:glycosyltransferase family 4 protein [Pseudomonadota bacterium]